MLSLRRARSLVFVCLLALAVFASGRRAEAQGADAGPAAPAKDGARSPTSWAAELAGIAAWAGQNGARTRCTERCFTLEKLRLSGKVGEGLIEFELRGGVLTDGAFAVPLFGPPSKVRIDGAKENDKDASIGFEGDRYYLHTSARRFTLKGSIALDGDLTLAIPGPLNTLDADLEGGAVVEGARLSGLSGATLHFSKDGGAGPTGPTVFQLSRAVRVGKEINFVYRLIMRSGADLGVVRLPLSFGEKVLDVAGSSGWRVEGKELVLPTSGRAAEMTISGSLAAMTTFAPEGRSGYEWWLFESDPEHRVLVKTDARQVDSAESPIARTEATSRLYLVQKGQRLDVSVEPLAGAEVLAAVVRSHSRRVVLTRRGDLVSDDTLAYENNGIDYLQYAPSSRPIYLAGDNKPERIMHQGDVEKEILIPLLTGSHTARVQALGAVQFAAFGGKIDIPMPSYPLTASRVGLDVGLPPGVVPVALLGGDRAQFTLDFGDALAMFVGLFVGALAVRPGASSSPGRTRALRALGGATLAGLWLIEPALFVLALVVMALILAIWLLGRIFKRGTRSAIGVAVIVGAGLLALSILMSAQRGSRAPMRDEYAAIPAQTPSAASPSSASDVDAVSKARLGNAALQELGAGGVLQGVTPVALSLPSHARMVWSSRELVTRERAFRPTLYYLTELVVLPLYGLWLIGFLAVIAAHREGIAGTYRRIRERLARGPEGDPSSARAEAAGEPAGPSNVRASPIPPSPRAGSPGS